MRYTESMNKEAQLLALHQKWEKDCACELRATASRAVFGDGTAQANIVFIGEAPGKKEDAGGKPFIGAAGKFLQEMLESIGMKREDIYITNIVKYRPPNNRDPQPQEKKECAQWLYDELNLIQPQLIIFLGRHAMNDFFPDLKISSAHGVLIHTKFPHIHTEHFLPLYHPAAALYNGSMREVLLADFAKIPAILEKIKTGGITIPPVLTNHQYH
jgi:uracil-DNA glycosylase